MPGKTAIQAYASASRTLTQDQLLAEAKAAFGEDPMTYAFICPRCNDIATLQDFKDAGASPNCAGQECIGRHLGALTGDANGIGGKDRTPRGCDWAAYGLFRGPWFVEMVVGEGEDQTTKSVAGFALAAIDGEPIKRAAVA